MKLIEYLNSQIANEESYFRKYLAKEDLARIEKLLTMAREFSREKYHKDGFLIGWSKDDMRTHELKETLIPLMDRVFDFVANPIEETDNAALTAWHDFHAQRLRVLIHCL